jgi:DMSO/TMAO reductase YedYZ molybdopterin-dependent catalytic subunit
MKNRKITRREVIEYSCLTMGGMALAGISSKELAAQGQGAQAQAQPEWPATLAERELRNIAPLPLNADGSAPEHPESAAGPISDPSLWRFNNNQPPQIDHDYRNMKIRVDTRGHAQKYGTLTFADLEKLPRHSATYLLQCGAPNPRGIVKWTGVRFRDFAEMLGMQPFAHYARFIGADRFWAEEDLRTLMHPQVMLAWMMNDQPIQPKHGAPLRLIIPFRYGARHVKAISEMIFTPTGFPLPQLPG